MHWALVCLPQTNLVLLLSLCYSLELTCWWESYRTSHWGASEVASENPAALIEDSSWTYLPPKVFSVMCVCVNQKCRYFDKPWVFHGNELQSSLSSRAEGQSTLQKRYGLVPLRTQIIIVIWVFWWFYTNFPQKKVNNPSQ